MISLVDADKRRALMRAQLDAPGMPSWSFVDATRGASLTFDETARFYDAKNAVENLTGPQIGCSISHLKVMETVARDEIDFAVVLEDDASVGFRFLETLDAVRTYIRTNDFTILFLGNARYFYGRSGQKIGPHHKIHKVFSAIGSHAYISNTQGSPSLPG